MRPPDPSTQRELKPRILFLALVVVTVVAVYAMDQLGKSSVVFGGLVSFVNVQPSDGLLGALTTKGEKEPRVNKMCALRAAAENMKILVRHRNDFDSRGEGGMLHRFLRVHAETSRICVVVDVGANTGTFSLAAVKFASDIENLECYVFAYEPVENTYSKLVEAVSASRGKIRPLNLGVGRQSALLPIRFTGMGDQHATFLSNTYKRQNGTTSKLVQVVALDEEVKPAGNLGQLGGLLTVVKISTEGFNYRALQGMRSLLHQQTIKMIMWEYDVRESTERRVTTEIDFISSHGYLVFLLGSKKGRTLEELVAGEPDDDAVRLLRVDGAFSNKQLDSIWKQNNMKLNLVAVVKNHPVLHSHYVLHSMPCGMDGCVCAKEKKKTHRGRLMLRDV